MSATTHTKGITSENNIVENDEIQDTNGITPTKTIKQTNSFLSWINRLNNNSQNIKTIPLPTEAENSSFNEYKGIQSLKEFWNSKITLITRGKQGKSATLDATHRKYSSFDSSLNASKSIGCLISDQSLNFDENKNKQEKEEGEVSLANKHLQFDNFYKFKNASTKKRLSLTGGLIDTVSSNSFHHPEVKESSVKFQKIYGIGTNFPLVAATPTGEKIHWAKREDIFVNRKSKQTLIDCVETSVQQQQQRTESAIKQRTDIATIDKKCLEEIGNEEKDSMLGLCVTNSEMAVKSFTMTDNSTTKEVAASSDKTDSGKSHNGSINSLSSDSPSRRRNPTSRKYSFKTHAKTYYGSSRKMAGHSGGNKVAALTHQFNQLLQKDAGILEEIKKKNGILMARAGHVYKVKEDIDNCKKRSTKKDSSIKGDDILLKGGKRKKVGSNVRCVKGDNEILSGSGTVKAAVKKFENKSCNKDEVKANRQNLSTSQKPKVPSKSEQVLLRTKELAMKNSQKKIKTVIEKGCPNLEIKSKILAEIVEETKNVENITELIQGNEERNNEKTDKIEKENSPMLDSVQNEKNDESNEKIDGKSENDSDDHEKLNEKNKYSRLYDKFRFQSPFAKKTLVNENSSSLVSFSKILEDKPEEKILVALETVDKKLEELSKSTNNLCSSEDRIETDRLYEELKAKMKPNDSFLFRGNTRYELLPDGNVNSETQVVEAVNLRLINKTQSMDEINSTNLSQIRQISFEKREYPNILQKRDEALDKFKQSMEKNNEEENDYEPITVRDCLTTIEPNDALAQKSFLYKSLSYHKNNNLSKVPDDSVDICCDDSNNIYQSLEEIEKDKRKNRNSVGSYESVENYETVPDDENEGDNFDESKSDKTLTEDGYDVCDPPEPPPPRKSDYGFDIRRTSDELPPIPVPKSNFRCYTVNSQSSEYVKNSVTTFVTKAITHYHQDHSILPDIPTSETLTISPHSILRHDNEHCYDDENIYDTIKNCESLSHCYESLSGKNISTSLDVTSVSNCYESIGSLRRNAVLRHSDSISTLSSDQKTNSLYGMTLGQQRSSLNGDGSSDDNSDEWIDISDGEDEHGHRSNKHQFIVVRERTKCHRSPDWSKRVRDQRVQQQATSYIDDDSDHYYETLYTRENFNENTNFKSNKTIVDNEIATPDNRPHLNPLVISEVNLHQQQQSSSLLAGENSFSDDYDSFDTDDETDEEVKKNDSGVDISNTKLPDPPPTTNQVYAFVKKVKNFISNKKTPSRSTSTENTSKPYENTQFYVSINPEYQNTNVRDRKNKSDTLSKLKISKSGSKLSVKSTSTPDGLYENMEFHTPRIPTTSTVSSENPQSVSSPFTTPIIPKLEETTEDTSNPPQIITRKKSKSGKSFKSKLRKSLGGTDSSFNIGNMLSTTRSTFYISDSVDVDSGIFEKNPSSDTNLSPAPSTEQCDTQQSTIVTRKVKKGTGSPELNRRKTTLGIRPSIPPPPPPVDKKTQKKRNPTTSWYAECGVFKSNNHIEELKDGKGERSSSTSWYAEAGLYQTSGASVASSSGSSGVSTGGEGGPGDDNSHSMFSNEPLYQIYSAAKLESISRDMEEQDSTDGYEEIGTLNRPEEQRKSSRPSALQLVGPKQGPSRTLWSEIPEVLTSGILDNLTATERRLQEAKFEILTSEASYLKSLNLLKTHFMSHPAFRDTSVLSSSDRKALFSYIIPVHECSDRLLCDLENCWQDNIKLVGLSKSLYKHAEKYFHVYVSFCEHQGKMDRTLRRLKENKGMFSQMLDTLESDAACCGLNLHSFLMLPMQRITRLPLLIDAVFSKLKQDDDEYEDWKITLAILNKIVSQCNEAANRCEQAYEIEKISRQIEFPLNIRSLAIAPVGIPAPGKKPRTLVKKGELIHIIWRGDDAKLTFGKKFTKCNIFLFLFTDLLVLTKKKNDEQYTAFDYCPRSMITVSSGDTIPQLPTKELTQAGKNLFLLTLLENHEGKTIEMVLSCPSVSEQQRWLQALSPPESENPDEKLYEQWDCPQVIAKHPYSATEPDLLSLEPGDVVNVTRKMADGWYEGERIRDGATGWFPGSFTEEVNSPHVRARNLKQRYRLLTFTATYLETIKRK